MGLMLRVTAVYWFLFLVMRGSGRRSLAELSPLDILVLVVIGDIVQQAINHEDMSVTGAIIAVGTLVTWALVGDWLSRRWRGAAEVLVGSPVMVVWDGEVLTEALEEQWLRLDDVLAAARRSGHGDLSEISAGVLEADGGFSFIAKGGK